MMKHRRVDDQWSKQIRESSGWLMFVRPSLIHPQDDIFSRPIQDVLASADEDGEPRDWTQQAWYTELVQLLLFVRGIGTFTPVSVPRLGIVLSCWDELPSTVGDSTTPESILLEKMPLFSQFLRSSWELPSLAIFGLSALGRSLSEATADESYRDHGPENFGYSIFPNGEKGDLVAPILWMLGD